jgi:hypothetical protein
LGFNQVVSFSKKGDVYIFDSAGGRSDAVNPLYMD